MRHRNGNRKLNRTSSHRAAMLRNMANSLLTHETIVTTLPKAKELRRVVEPLITLGKKPSLANRRLAFNRTRDRDVVVKLFDELGPRFSARRPRSDRSRTRCRAGTGTWRTGQPPAHGTWCWAACSRWCR